MRSRDNKTSEAVKRAVGVKNIPRTSQALRSFPNISYADQFAISEAHDSDNTPEQWGRAIFGDVPNLTQRFLWGCLLCLRLQEGPSPNTVAGWRIGSRSSNWIRLENKSWFLSVNLLVEKSDRKVSLTTFIHYEQWLGRVWWPPLAFLHRLVVPLILRKAKARICASR